MTPATIRPIVNITMPVFNRPELTERTVRSVAAHTRPEAYRLTCVDNGSDAPTREVLCRLHSEGLIHTVYRLEANYGVAVAANIGWLGGWLGGWGNRPEYYMKLDNDIEILRDDWLEHMLYQICRLGRTVVLGADLNNQMNNPDLVTEREGLVGRTRAHVSGGAVIIPREVSAVAGYCSEDYGLYGCEDGDYGVRLNVLGVEQYYMDHRHMMRHLGHDAAQLRQQHNLHKKHLQQINRLRFATNRFLYEQGLRAPNVPPRYVVSGVTHHSQGHRLVQLSPKTSYSLIARAFARVHAVLRTAFGAEGTHRPHLPPHRRSFIDEVNRFVSAQNRHWQDAQDAVRTGAALLHT